MTARWIWRSEGEPSPTNTFTWFRRVVTLDELPPDASLRFAADSTAQLWLNGRPLRRKVTRFHEPAIRAENVEGVILRLGPNVLTVLHHNWGTITTFQRTQNAHAGLYLDSSWVVSDERWEWLAADEFESHDRQFLGVADAAPRVRFPVRWNARAGRELRDDPREDDGAAWRGAAIVHQGPWPATPETVETPGQRESDQRPLSVLAAGESVRSSMTAQEVRSVLSASHLLPDSAALEHAARLLDAEPVTISGRAGETRYLTVDFGRPIHGYPFFESSADVEVDVDLGYGELAISPYDGRALVEENGWIDVDAVVATGYADVVLAATERRRYELPDERTARWLTMHITFPTAGSIIIHDLGIVKSQYPIEPRGSFRSGDELLDQIVKLCEIHAEVTMSDAFVDTPGREDGQWIEDARPRAQIAERWFGDTRLRRLAIRTLAEGQGSDGQLHPFFPSNFPAYPAPWDWSVQWIAMLYDDFVWHHELDFVARHWPTVQRLWARLLEDVGDDGIWRSSSVLGDIRNSVQPGDGASSGLITPWIIERLRWSSRMAEAVHDAGHAETWRATAERMADSFRRSHVDRSRDDVSAIVADVYDPAADRHEGYGQTAQLEPLLDGSLDGDEARRLIDFAFPGPDASPPSGIARWNNPSAVYRVLSVLSAHGHERRALAHLLERYAPYLPGHPRNVVPPALQGPYGGPLPEYWVSRADRQLRLGEINTAQPVDASGSHGWGAVPLLWLHESLLGVTFTGMGSNAIRIAPVSAGLPYIQGSTVTPMGTVTVYFDPSAHTLSVEIPFECDATLVFPREFHGLMVRDVDRPGSAYSASEPLPLVEAGRYTFTTAGPAGTNQPGSGSGQMDNTDYSELFADTIRSLESGTSSPDPRTDIDTASLAERYPELGTVSTREVTIPARHGDIAARLYLPDSAPKGCLVWAHGGSFIGGNLDMPEAHWVSLAVAARGFTVLSVEYTKALFGVHFPVPPLDLLDAWNWAGKELGLDPATMHLGGASAGGNLAASVGLRLRDGQGQLPASLVLVYPQLHAVSPRGSTAARAAAETLAPESRFPQGLLTAIAANYLGPDHRADEPYAYAGSAEVAGLPPLLILNSESDEHRYSGEEFARQAIDAGVTVQSCYEPGSVHGHLDRPHSAEAQRSIARITHWLGGFSRRTAP